MMVGAETVCLWRGESCMQVFINIIFVCWRRSFLTNYFVDIKLILRTRLVCIK